MSRSFLQPPACSLNLSSQLLPHACLAQRHKASARSSSNSCALATATATGDRCRSVSTARTAAHSTCSTCTPRDCAVAVCAARLEAHCGLAGRTVGCGLRADCSADDPRGSTDGARRATHTHGACCMEDGDGAQQQGVLSTEYSRHSCGAMRSTQVPLCCACACRRPLLHSGRRPPAAPRSLEPTQSRESQQHRPHCPPTESQPTTRSTAHPLCIR